VEHELRGLPRLPAPEGHVGGARRGQHEGDLAAAVDEAGDVDVDGHAGANGARRDRLGAGGRRCARVGQVPFRPPRPGEADDAWSESLAGVIRSLALVGAPPRPPRSKRRYARTTGEPSTRSTAAEP